MLVHRWKSNDPNVVRFGKDNRLNRGLEKATDSPDEFGTSLGDLGGPNLMKSSISRA